MILRRGEYKKKLKIKGYCCIAGDSDDFSIARRAQLTDIRTEVPMSSSDKIDLRRRDSRGFTSLGRLYIERATAIGGFHKYSNIGMPTG